MGKLNQIDKAAESKGSLLVTIWQFVKFIVVSLLAMIVQFVLLNTLNLIPPIAELYNQDFAWWVFVYPVAVGGLGPMSACSGDPQSVPPKSSKPCLSHDHN